MEVRRQEEEEEERRKEGVEGGAGREGRRELQTVGHLATQEWAGSSRHQSTPC